MNLELNKKDIIYFIGIAGIGMSGIALIMHEMGYLIEGSDNSSSGKILDKLKLKNIKVIKGHNSRRILNSGLVVISSAIKNNNPELKLAKKHNKIIIKRADMLAHLLNLKKNIIVSGSHGKTTITSLISTIFREAKLYPTIINGGVINSLNSNASLGKSDWAIVEADESDGSFLKFKSIFSIVSNIDYEHMDYYKKFSNLKNKFFEFINNTPLLGKNFVCIDDKNVSEVIKKYKKRNYITYGFSKKANVQCCNLRYLNMMMIFDLKIKISNKTKKIKNITINLIGKHNALNATVAFIIAIFANIKLEKIKKSLKNFAGVQRRLTLVFKDKKRLIFDDYAHHPTEIKAVLDACHNNFKNRKIITIFQPHRYSRVISLYEEFCKSFAKSDVVLLCPIYSAGEKSNQVDLKEFARKISEKSNCEVIIIKNENEIEIFIKKNLLSDEIIIAMGAGSISSWIRKISEKLKINE